MTNEHQEMRKNTYTQENSKDLQKNIEKSKEYKRIYSQKCRQAQAAGWNNFKLKTDNIKDTSMHTFRKYLQEII